MVSDSLKSKATIIGLFYFDLKKAGLFWCLDKKGEIFSNLGRKEFLTFDFSEPAFDLKDD